MSRPAPGDPATSTFGLVEMLRSGVDGPDQVARAGWGALLLLLAWAGFTQLSGVHLGGPWGPPTVAGLPRPAVLAAIFVGCALTGTILQACGTVRRRPLGWLALAVAAYLAGNLLSGAAHGLIPLAAVEARFGAGPRFMLSRLVYALSVALPMLAVAAPAARSLGFALPLRWGDLSARTRLGKGDPLRSWRRLLLVLGLGVGAPFFLLMQAWVDFAPLQSGRIPPLLLVLAGMALANAFAEELLFRGLLQPVAEVVMGPARGMWAVSLLFGLHHAGASFAPLASVGGALLLGVGSVVLARSARETGGLAWCVCFHAILNVGTFAAFYVAT
jgi:membrane protease YdiL (CAAX protease family)